LLVRIVIGVNIWLASPHIGVNIRGISPQVRGKVNYTGGLYLFYPIDIDYVNSNRIVYLIDGKFKGRWG